MPLPPTPAIESPRRIARAMVHLLLSLAIACFAAQGGNALAAVVALSPAEAQNWRDDLDFLAREMPRKHRNLYHTVTRVRFESAVQALHAQIPSLARHEVIVRMAAIVAMVGDGHTNIAPTRDPKIGFRSYPVRLYSFKDGLYIRSAPSAWAHLVGGRVTDIGNATVAQAYAKVRDVIGRDNEMGAKFFAPHLLAMPEVLHALGIINDMEQASFVVDHDGRSRTFVLAPFASADMMPPDTDTSWIRKEGWVDARGVSDPLWLSQPENKYWFKYLPDSRTVYLQLNQVGNKEAEGLEAFSARMLQFIDATPVDRLVLDLRLNRGGNGDFNRLLLRSIIKSRKVDEKGKLFVLTGRSTFSAAQFLVNGLEKYTNAIFIGEPTGGKVNSYGDSRRITLPNSGMTVRVSILWWQEDERDRRQWRAPDIAAELSFADYRAGRDSALQAAIDYVRKPSLREQLAQAYAGGDTQLAARRLSAWRADPANSYADAEPELIALGYELLAAKHTALAIDVFGKNVEISPGSANAYDSLAEAHAIAGNKDLAIKNYRHALAIDPGMSSATAALELLQKTP